MGFKETGGSKKKSYEVIEEIMKLAEVLGEIAQEGED